MRLIRFKSKKRKKKMKFLLLWKTHEFDIYKTIFNKMLHGGKFLKIFIPKFRDFFPPIFPEKIFFPTKLLYFEQSLFLFKMLLFSSRYPQWSQKAQWRSAQHFAFFLFFFLHGFSFDLINPHLKSLDQD